MDVKITLIIDQNKKELLNNMRRKLNLTDYQKENFSKRKILKSKSKSKRTNTEKSINKAQNSSKHFKHDSLTQENFNPKN